MKISEVITQSPLHNVPTIKVDGVLRPIHNSDGMLIAPTADAQVVFWRWFRRSKVTDEHGRPRVVHRGDRPGKTEFSGREDPSSYIQGNIFFSSSRDIAKGYTAYRTNYYVASKDMDQSHGLYSAYLRIEKPVVVNARGEDWSRIPLSGRLKKEVGWPAIQIDDLALYVQKTTNNDGLIVRDVWDQFGDGDQFVVFNNQQIRLISSI